MNRWKIDLLLELFREAGAVALRFQENPEVGIKSDHTAVTRADREIEALFAARLDRPGNGSFLIGEESIEQRDEEYIKSALEGECFVLDPVDGTAPYAAGVPLWGISVGFMRNGVLEEGAICLPPRDEAFLSCRVRSVQELGSHDLFLADIVEVSVQDRFFLPDGSIDEAAMELVGYAHGKYFVLGEALGFFGYSVASPEALERRGF